MHLLFNCPYCRKFLFKLPSMIIIIIDIMILINPYHCIYIYTCTNTTKLFTYSKIYMNKCITFLSVSIRAHAMTIDNAAAAKKKHDESQTTMQLRLPCKRFKNLLGGTKQTRKIAVTARISCSVVDRFSQCLNHSDTKSTLMYLWNKTSNAFKEEEVTPHFRGRPRCIYPLLPSLPASHQKNSLVDPAC